tara:strand:- start:846 stop:3053 length:2208 start_codon:yes stop_codon:yes gene_type:complete
MIKLLIRSSLYIVIILILIISYLSFFGFNTEKFNNKIKSKVLNISKIVNLELKSVKFQLNPFNLSINIKTFEPELIVNNNKLKLESIKTNISLKSFISKKFFIDNLQISTNGIKLKEFVLLARSFKNSAELFILDKIIKDGYLVGDIDLNFDDNGKIKNDFEINGFIKNGELGFLGRYNIKNLNFLFKIKDKKYFLKDIKTEFSQIKLSSELITIKQQKDIFLINGSLSSDKKDIDIKILNNLLEDGLKNFNITNINFNLDTNFNFTINKKFKISNIDLKSKINLNQLSYYPKLPNLKKYLPNFKEFIELKDHIILINYKKNQLVIDGKGQLIIENKHEDIDYKVTKSNNNYIFGTQLKINNTPFLIDILQYRKNKNLDSLIKLSGIYNKDKKIKFDLISINENNNSFLIKDLKLNNKFKILDIGLLNLNYINTNNIHNNLNLKKNKKDYEINAKNLDVTRLINEIFSNENKKDRESFFANLNSNIKIRINKAFLDKAIFAKNLNGSIEFKNNKINKLDLDSNFSNNKKLTLTINTNQNNEKITTLFSNYPKPLVNQYKFVKGFEEGVLDFYSVKKKNGISNSKLVIDNFKVQEVPVLAKLLSLASLQGIADLLTGEGIRFTDLEMKFSNKKELMTIEELYAIGPAISILMDGYIENKKLISLRGTLIPATTINRSIASIPLIGNILIGKKTGEGVFGVSFKIKGAPNNLKTTVNPVKTLTPRFITRTLEKIKKN